jgi:hypothetical protein
MAKAVVPLEAFQQVRQTARQPHSTSESSELVLTSCK